nr:hypothetical protein [Brevundimonas naejangsanensis]
MKTSLDHLPPLKRLELQCGVEVLRQSFAEATATKRADRLKNGRILKIILYGSSARGDWVHDPVGRYRSDFDILGELREAVRVICMERLQDLRRDAGEGSA